MGSLLTLRVPSTGSNSVDISLFSAACCLEGMNLSLKRTGDVSFIDKFDFASGTSSRSTKLAHGGIRYFEQMMFL